MACRCPSRFRAGRARFASGSDFADGKPREVVADLELLDVSATLGDRAAGARARASVGSRGLEDDGVGREFFTQALAFSTDRGDHLDPTNFKLTLRDESTRPAGQMEFDRLQLEPSSR
jgi:hypothetical protein